MESFFLTAVRLCSGWVPVALISLGITPLVTAAVPSPAREVQAIFDGRTLSGWEGNPALWRVENGCITGGSLDTLVAENEFLCTTTRFTNFILRLKFKLTGTNGFINSGIQIRTERLPGRKEVSGYQCDLGDPDWWGAIYDESRRNRVLCPTDMIALEPVLRRSEWNDYVIRADGPRITVWLNGLNTADYYEDDPHIAREGIIGVQLHGGGKPVVQLKDLTVEKLPDAPPFLGAGTPLRLPHASPLIPAEEQASFSLPPGFEIELVASEEEGVIKPITVEWDSRGRMWTMTAQEYPVDANDNKEVAEALYGQPRRDRILVFDGPLKAGGNKPRVFADGLAIPLGLLPYRDGVFVQHGPEILFLRDTKGAGRADKRGVILSGFGIGDSHLMPHQFTRAPGGWIYFAQGAFNNSQVRTSTGETFEFNRTLMGKFLPDGSRFETIGWGPCNIWGLVLTGEGEIFIQEANDYGYPLMPFNPGAFYPGCTAAPKPYAPTFPGLSRAGMGGTGLSGLALADEHGSFPAPYNGIFYVANPVTQRIQAILVEPDGPGFSLLKLPDFIRTADEWFRPVAIHFGPDGCLYIVDWYNKVISHNEIPRQHPDRDKSRGRIWRVRHRDQKARDIPDFTHLKEAELLSLLGSESLWRSHTAWQQIVDRQGGRLAPMLEEIAADKKNSAARRLQALWALEGVATPSLEVLGIALLDSNRNLRREAVRIFGRTKEYVGKVEGHIDDPDPSVRAEIIRSTGPKIWDDPAAFRLLLRMIKPRLAGPLGRSTQNGKPMKVREAYDRDFERYLVRAALEKNPGKVEMFLESGESAGAGTEALLLAALAVEPRRSAQILARYLPAAGREPDEEEILRLAQFAGEPSVAETLNRILKNASMRRAAVEALLKGRTRFDTSALIPVLTPAAIVLAESDAAGRELALRLGSAFKLKELEPILLKWLRDPASSVPEQLAILRGLKEMGAGSVGELVNVALGASDASVRNEAILAVLTTEGGIEKILALWPKWNASQQRLALDRLAATRAGARALVVAASKGIVTKSSFDSNLADKLLTVLGDDAVLAKLLEEIGSASRPVLKLNGKEGDYVETHVTLSGPFTVETWIRLDSGIGNEDGILGRPGGADFNFFDGRLRVFAGAKLGDVIVARRKMTAELWTHLAVSRDESGHFKIYLDGELDTGEGKTCIETFTDLDLGRTSRIGTGTGAWFSEFRVWHRCMAGEEIRRDFDRSGEGLGAGLGNYFSGTNWPGLHGTARIVRTVDFPPVITEAESKAWNVKFDKYRALAQGGGDSLRGKEMASVCLTCHLIQGNGGAIGPNLSGAGAMGLDSLLRSILTPNAAMEAGYRTYRVQLLNDEIVDAFYVSEDKDAVIVRRAGMEDTRINKSEIRHAQFIRRSLMPEGMLEAMPDRDAADLLSYLQTLK